MILSRLSFRQLLLTAFLLIVAFLSATSVQALLTLERLASHSRTTAQEAVQLTENAQRLAERTVAMERSARQFLVLNDPTFRARFIEAAQDAGTALTALAAHLPAVDHREFDIWRTQSNAVRTHLEAAPAQRKQHQEVLEQAFARLQAINTLLAVESKREVERRNSALLGELEHQRSVLTAQVAGAILLAILLAFGFGFWLSRPMASIEAAIDDLGKNRYERPIAVTGPADLRKLGQQLDWLRQRLAQLEADKTRFLSHISHELKTPLAAMREGVALLEEEVAGQLSGNQREVAAILRQNTIALQIRIEDLLRYNAAAFEARRMQREPADLLALLKQIIDAHRLQSQARGLLVELHGTSLIAYVDVEKLRVAVGNLLMNAVRFSPEGGTIVLNLAHDRQSIHIECQDEGCGIATHDATRIFEPFYQGQRQPPGARRGSGIGLSIVREYVEAHRGTVCLAPVTAGACFRIELPHES